MSAWLALLLHALVLYFCVCTISGQAPSTLRMVNVVFRHGDRSPMGTFPGDLHNESSWRQGFAQLTQVGMQQEHKLGQFFRARYSGFLNSMYKRSEIHVQSTNTDRTLMSAQMVMAGLYPPQVSQRWNDSIPWQPIPIFAMEVAKDRLFKYSSDQCPAIGKHREKIHENPRVRQVLEKHKDLLDMIYNHTGATISPGFNQTSISGVRDTLYCEHMHNLKLPSWVKIPQTLDDLTDIKVVTKKYKYCSDTRVVRLTGGLILERMITDMKVLTKKLVQNNFKALMYSAHDTNVLALLCSMNVYNDRLVPYSTAVMVELHHGKVGESRSDPDWFVQVWLRNDSSHDPYPLVVPGCLHSCPLDRFVNLTRGNIADNWNSECGFFSINVDSLWRFVVIAVATGLGIILVLLLLSCCCHRKCKRRHLRPRQTYGKLRPLEEVPMMSPGGDSDIEG